ncbi:hypothetical protein D3C84_581030 [compost metagenome]
MTAVYTTVDEKTITRGREWNTKASFLKAALTSIIFLEKYIYDEIITNQSAIATSLLFNISIQMALVE